MKGADESTYLRGLSRGVESGMPAKAQSAEADPRERARVLPVVSPCPRAGAQGLAAGPAASGSPADLHRGAAEPSWGFTLP